MTAERPQSELDTVARMPREALERYAHALRDELETAQKEIARLTRRLSQSSIVNRKS